MVVKYFSKQVQQISGEAEELEGEKKLELNEEE
jgi:hypothetical protein